MKDFREAGRGWVWGSDLDAHGKGIHESWTSCVIYMNRKKGHDEISCD